MTTTERRTRTITLTGRAPVKIVEEDWPVIAKADAHAQRRHTSVRVRRHLDGRSIVYGTRGGGFVLDLSAGAIIAAGDQSIALPEAIRAVCADLGAPELAQRLIADLPAVAI